MSDIQFTDEPSDIRLTDVGSSPSWLTQLPIRLGLARDDIGARNILLAITVITIIAAVAVFIMSGPKPVPYVPVDVTRGI